PIYKKTGGVNCRAAARQAALICANLRHLRIKKANTQASLRQTPPPKKNNLRESAPIYKKTGGVNCRAAARQAALICANLRHLRIKKANTQASLRQTANPQKNNLR
ncbi:MAG: hypothetical protein ACOX9E_15905, partial [Lentisphaeria bacterium]